MTPAPCYDTVNHRDCPDREWCKTVGRNQCEKWVKYEKAHQAELEALNRERIQRNADYEANQRLRKRLSKRSRY